MAQHLMSNENDHVETLQVRGFISDSVQGGLQEAYAHSRATQCKKFLFSASFSPPEDVVVSDDTFIEAIDRAEKKLGLTNQPRVVVTHAKNGRVHAHCVWSRIDTENIKAIKLNYYKRDLNTLAKDLFIEHGWDLPKGFEDSSKRDLRTFNLEEWQQAKRHNLNPKQIKARIQYCWKYSDNKASFKTALEHEGFFLAKGDKNNVHVAVDWHGEVYAITRNTGQKAKDVRARVGKADNLPTVETTKALMAKEQSALHQRLQKELSTKHQMQSQPLLNQKKELVAKQRQVRENQQVEHQKRQLSEQQARQASYQKGFKGLWMLVTGRYHKQKQQHEAQYQASLERDKHEKQQLAIQQTQKRQALQKSLNTLNERQQKEQMRLNRDVMAHHKGMGINNELKGEFSQQRGIEQKQPTQQPTMEM